jgi:hypothetical protein
MESIKYLETFEEILQNINYLVKEKKLTESQIIKLFDLIDIEILLKNNKMSKQFMEKILRPKIEDDFSDFGAGTINITFDQACKMQENIK